MHDAAPTPVHLPSHVDKHDFCSWPIEDQRELMAGYVEAVVKICEAGGI